MPVRVKHVPTGDVLAEADPATGAVVQYEGNWYFAPEAVDEGRLRISARTYTCPYKGTCFWVDLVEADGKTTPDVAWVYPETKRGHEVIANRYGFYAGTRGATGVESTG
jgi:uncharacterized protein (DUF427 family)